MARNPATDPSSIGRILLQLPSVTPEDLEKAVAFHHENEDLMLGESMIRLGIITRYQLDAAVIQQRRMRNETAELLEYATQRTRAVAAGVGTLTALGASLLLKMKGQ